MCQVQSQQGWHAEDTTKLQVVVHLLKTLKIVSTSTRLDLQTIQSKLSSFSAYSLLVRVAGWI